MRIRPRPLLGAVAAGLLSVSVLPVGVAGAQGEDPSVVGRFAAPFEQPGPACTQTRDQQSLCKPAAASVVVLPTGKIVYWDALEGMEDVRYSVVAEYGNTAQNDQARLLDLSGPSWQNSDPSAVSNPQGNDAGNGYLPVVPHNNDQKANDGDLFCSDQVFLADGRVLDTGGTSYYLEPGVSGVGYGVSELKGLRNTRIFDGATNTWSAAGPMAYGRWYPSLVTLPDGKVFVASGVDKLIKPVYPDRPGDSGRNVTQTETFDPRTGTWSYNGASADKSLPLFPRLHLLPDGHVYYDAAGQTFNPSGQAYDEALWNMASSYDPVSRTWTDLGLPAFDGVLQGFRGSSFSQMLPLVAPYTKASFLSAGGVYGVTPGTYVATDSSVVNTVDTTGGKDSLTSTVTAPLNHARWYSSAVTLPTGQVLAFSGADRDEVVAPGSGTPVRTPEMFDPATGRWTVLADQSHGRTYHNTATLLPDGRVLVGGHAPIATGYAAQNTAGQQALGLSSPYRDPSFEIFSPPNLFYGPRPVIADVAPSVQRGSELRIDTPDASVIRTVSLVRNTAITHLVDGDQRVVELPVVSRDPGSVTVAVTGKAAVLPDGPYELFANAGYAKGLTPSVSRQVFVGAVPPDLLPTIVAHNAAAAASELAARSSHRADGAHGAAARARAGRPEGAARSGSAGASAAAPAGARPAGSTGSVASLALALAAARGAAREAAGPLPLAGLLLAGLGTGALLFRRRRTG